MTDRIHAVTVFLSNDIRDDDIEPILTALRMVRGVASVKPIVTSHADVAARERVRYELRDRLRQLVDDAFKP